MSSRVFCLATALLLAWGSGELFAQSSSSRSSSFRSSTRSTTNTGSPFDNLQSETNAQSGTTGGVGTGTGAGVGTGPQTRQGQQGGFVGRDAEDVRQTFQNLNGRQRRRMMFDMMVENLNEMRESRRRRRARRNEPPAVHLQLRPEFDYPSTPAVVVQSNIQTRLVEVMQNRSVDAPQVEMDGRTATLRGTVGSDRDKALVAQLVRLEPGISEVENLLVVEGVEVQ